MARDVGRADEHVHVTTLAALDPEIVDMRTVVIIGSSVTRAFTDERGRMFAYTPRTYPSAD